jgi:UDP-glucuronate decarboxylase
MVRSMDTPHSFTGPVHVGNPNQFPMLGLARQAIELTGWSCELVFAELPFDGPKQRQPDSSLTGVELGWKPSVEPGEGPTPTIDYFRATLPL